jgi:hypothetical protein
MKKKVIIHYSRGPALYRIVGLKNLTHVWDRKHEHAYKLGDSIPEDELEDLSENTAISLELRIAE